MRYLLVVLHLAAHSFREVNCFSLPTSIDASAPTVGRGLADDEMASSCDDDPCYSNCDGGCRTDKGRRVCNTGCDDKCTGGCDAPALGLHNYVLRTTTYEGADCSGLGTVDEKEYDYHCLVAAAGGEGSRITCLEREPTNKVSVWRYHAEGCDGDPYSVVVHEDGVCSDASVKYECRAIAEGGADTYIIPIAIAVVVLLSCACYKRATVLHLLQRVLPYYVEDTSSTVLPQVAVPREDSSFENLDAVFAKYDTNADGKLNKDEVRVLLNDMKRETLNDPSAEVKPHILEQVLKKYGGRDQLIDKNELGKVVAKYKKFLAKDSGYI